MALKCCDRGNTVLEHIVIFCTFSMAIVVSFLYASRGSMDHVCLLIAAAYSISAHKEPSGMATRVLSIIVSILCCMYFTTVLVLFVLMNETQILRKLDETLRRPFIPFDTINYIIILSYLSVWLLFSILLAAKNCRNVKRRNESYISPPVPYTAPASNIRYTTTTNNSSPPPPGGVQLYPRYSGYPAPIARPEEKQGLL